MTDTLTPADPTTASPDSAAIMELGLGFWGSKTLLSAVELGVFTAVAAGPLTVDELTEQLSLHPRAVRDFLDVLVALGLLDRGDDGYCNTRESDAFLDRAKPSYVGGLLEMANARMYENWGRLTEALRTGRPQNEAKDGGTGFLGGVYDSPEGLRGFVRGMTAASMGIAHALAEVFPWERYGSVTDAGGAEGCVPVVLAQRHPHLDGVVFDLPPVAPIADEYVTANGLSGRIRFEGGDFFTDPIPPADVVVLGHILHDWGLDAKRALLAKAYAAVPDGGAVIVYDAVIDDDRRHNAFGLLMSLNMAIETEDGFDYTGADCRRWLAEAGFSTSFVQPLTGPDSMVVGIK